jgi:hypothetical protein
MAVAAGVVSIACLGAVVAFFEVATDVTYLEGLA